MMSMPFNSSTTIMWVNDDALIAAGLDPATTLAQVLGRGPRRREAGRRCRRGPLRLLVRVAELEPVRELQRHARRPARDPDERHGRPGRRARDQQPAARRPRARCSPRWWRRVRPRTAAAATPRTRCSPRASAPSSRPPRACSRASTARRPSPGPRTSCPSTGSSAREPQNSIIGGASLWVMQSPTRTIEEYTRGRRVLQLPRAARSRRAVAPRHRLPADRQRRLREARGRGLLRRAARPGRPVPAADQPAAHRELPRAAARQHARDPRHHRGRDRDGASRARRRPRRRSTAPWNAATSCSATSSAPSAESGSARGALAGAPGTPPPGRPGAAASRKGLHAAAHHLPPQVPPLPAPGAAARHHDRLLLLPGRSGHLPVDAARRPVRAPHHVRLVRELRPRPHQPAVSRSRPGSRSCSRSPSRSAPCCPRSCSR